MSQRKENISLLDLWKQFLPLSLSDVTMACGDPAITTTLAHLPSARENLAAIGVAKSIAVFFESPIIMLLHASNALAASRKSRRALWRFTILAMVVLTTLLVTLSLPPVFRLVATYILGINSELAAQAGFVILLLALWPAAIAWRRYFQGLLIHYGYGHSVGRAGLMRLSFVVTILMFGYYFKMNGTLLGPITLVGGVIAEALFVTVASNKYNVTKKTDPEIASSLPINLKGVWHFYWPLANSMVIVWGGRALLIGVIARAVDGPIALAVWPAAWGIVLLIGNATRMIQQVIIKNRKNVTDALLFQFTASVGISCSIILILLGTTSIGKSILGGFIGNDAVLLGGMIPVILICSLLPLLIAFQNATQGLLISEGKTLRVNVASLVGTVTLLLSAAIGVGLGFCGSTVAATAMFLALLSETLWLFGEVKSVQFIGVYASA